jgi:hypothetical protein
MVPQIGLERSGIAAPVKDPANGVIITRLAKPMPVSMSRQHAQRVANGASKMTVS